MYETFIEKKNNIISSKDSMDIAHNDKYLDFS
jgi:hypothetical protein